MKNKDYILSIILVIFLLFTINCNSQASNFVITSVDKKQYSIFIKDAVYEKNDISLKNKFESKKGVNITTKLKNISFKNNTAVDEDNDGYKKYEYLYFLKSHKKHLIKFTYFEGDQYLLIDDNSGKVDTLDSEPIIIGNHLLVIYQDMNDADQFSTLKYYVFNTENNLKLINVKKERWILSQYLILKNNKLALIVNLIKDNKIKYHIGTFKN